MFKSTARKTIKSVVYARAAILLATACCAVPAWAQTAPTPTPHVPMATDTIQEGRHGDVAVTQKDPLRTGEDNTTGKPPPVYHLLGFGLSGTHRIDVGHRQRRIFFTEMHLHRTVGAFVLRARNATAVPAR